jgi:hypothetical protein
MSLDEFMMDDDCMTDNDGLADTKIDLKAVADQLDVVIARVLDDAALNPDDPQSYIVLRMALATFTKVRLSVREQAMIAGDSATYFETIANRLRAEMRDAPEWLH